MEVGETPTLWPTDGLVKLRAPESDTARDTASKDKLQPSDSAAPELSHPKDDLAFSKHFDQILQDAMGPADPRIIKTSHRNGKLEDLELSESVVLRNGQPKESFPEYRGVREEEPKLNWSRNRPKAYVSKKNQISKPQPSQDLVRIKSMDGLKPTDENRLSYSSANLNSLHRSSSKYLHSGVRSELSVHSSSSKTLPRPQNGLRPASPMQPKFFDGKLVLGDEPRASYKSAASKPANLKSSPSPSRAVPRRLPSPMSILKQVTRTVEGLKSTSLLSDPTQTHGQRLGSPKPTRIIETRSLQKSPAANRIGAKDASNGRPDSKQGSPQVRKLSGSDSSSDSESSSEAEESDETSEESDSEENSGSESSGSADDNKKSAIPQAKMTLPAKSTPKTASKAVAKAATHKTPSSPKNVQLARIKISPTAGPLVLDTKKPKHGRSDTDTVVVVEANAEVGVRKTPFITPARPSLRPSSPLRLLFPLHKGASGGSGKSPRPLEQFSTAGQKPKEKTQQNSMPNGCVKDDKPVVPLTLPTQIEANWVSSSVTPVMQDMRQKLGQKEHQEGQIANKILEGYKTREVEFLKRKQLQERKLVKTAAQATTPATRPGPQPPLVSVGGKVSASSSNHSPSGRRTHSVIEEMAEEDDESHI